MDGPSPGRSIRRLVARGAAIGGCATLALTFGLTPAVALDGPSGTEAGSDAGVRLTTTEPSSEVINIARQYVGTPYVWGGSTPAGFDCSGFVQHVFVQVGIDLPRTADLQAGAGEEIPAEEAVSGDLVWWPGHIGIYTGEGNHIAARSPGTLLYESPIYLDDPTFIRVLDTTDDP